MRVSECVWLWCLVSVLMCWQGNRHAKGAKPNEITPTTRCPVQVYDMICLHGACMVIVCKC